jgi:hypothetical protein
LKLRLKNIPKSRNFSLSRIAIYKISSLKRRILKLFFKTFFTKINQ